MTVSWQIVARVALLGVLALILCAPAPVIWGCACTTGDIAHGTDLSPDEARAPAPELAATTAKPGRDPVVSDAAAAGEKFSADRVQPSEWVPARSTVAPSASSYVRHCAFLC